MLQMEKCLADADDGFAGLRVEILKDRGSRREAFALRYHSYLSEGAIQANDRGWFADRYDLGRTALLFGALDQTGRVVGSIRFAVQPPRAAGFQDFQSGPEFEVFPDALAKLGGEERTLASGSRFAIMRDHPLRSKVALMLVFALINAGRAVNAEFGIATARGSHLQFYRRMLRMQPICDPRLMPNLVKSYTLLSVDIDREYNRILNFFPQSCRAHFEAQNSFWGAEVALSLRKVSQGDVL